MRYEKSSKTSLLLVCTATMATLAGGSASANANHKRHGPVYLDIRRPDVDNKWCPWSLR
jgi:hypothetical protein